MFWAFFEQAGSSINVFTDRNVDRVIGYQRVVTKDDVGQTIRLEPTQEQLGYTNGGKMFTLTELDKLREEHKNKTNNQTKTKENKPDEQQAPALTIAWQVDPGNVGMQIATRANEVPTSSFQAVNPIYILLLGLAFTALWTFLGTHGLEPSTPFKFALGLLQLGLGFVALWYGTQVADDRGMVAVGWLLLAYLLHTTAELCLSPVGLSMITKLAPAVLVSTVMGAWFLATGVSQFLAGIIAQFTKVGEGAGETLVVPPPIETVHTYGHVYGIIAIAAGVFALICFCLVPLLKRWMHEDEA
jgi:POT family proton-dependent oligopeptide transporter